MDITETLHAEDREAWRAWLEVHHAAEREIWLIFPKKHTGTPSVSYEEAVQEALCFGWIDSIMKRIDGDSYAQKFTPRKRGSEWSELNKRRVRALIAEGRMTPAGLAKVTFPLAEAGDPAPAARAEPALSPELAEVLEANPAAWAIYVRLPRSERRRYAGWIMDAVKPETRRRRLEEAIGKLAEGRPLGTK